MRVKSDKITTCSMIINSENIWNKKTVSLIYQNLKDKRVRENHKICMLGHIKNDEDEWAMVSICYRWRQYWSYVVDENTDKYV